MTRIVLTSLYYVEAREILPTLWQLIVAAELLEDIPSSHPPLGCDFPSLVHLAPILAGRAFSELGYGARGCWAERLHDVQSHCIPIGQIKVHHSTNRVCTHCLELAFGLDILELPSVFGPRRANP